MRVADRVTDVADRVQTRRLESKRDTLDRDNERLRTELRSTRQELDRERSARDELLDALKRGEGSVKADKVKIKTKKRGGLFRLLIVGGGAYVLGSRAGRERYDQIRGWASGMKDRMQSRNGGDEWSSMSSGGSSDIGTGSIGGSIGGSGSTSGMSGSTGTTTGTGSTSSGATGGSSSTGSGSGTTGGSSTTGGSTTGGSTTGSSSGTTGSGTSGSGSSTGGAGTSGGTSSTSKRSGSSGSTSSS